MDWQLFADFCEKTCQVFKTWQVWLSESEFAELENFQNNSLILKISDSDFEITPQGNNMPTISMFYGILVSIFFMDNDRHYLPHIHVRYQGMKASVAIEDGQLLDGTFPPKQLKLVQAWIEIHRDELLADWELAIAGEEPFRIPPLQ